MTKKQWTTESGQVINVEYVTDEHLWNTRRMLQLRGRPIYEEIRRRNTQNTSVGKKKLKEDVMPKNLTAARAYEISSRALDTVMKDVINTIIGAAEDGKTNCLVTLKPNTLRALWQELTALGYGLTEECANNTLRISWEKNKED